MNRFPALLSALVLASPLSVGAQDAAAPVFPDHLTWTLAQGDELPRARAPECGGRALRVTGAVESAPGDGVIVSHGGVVQGWAVTIQDGKLTGYVRSDSALHRVQAAAPVPASGFRFRFDIGADGALKLFLNDDEAAAGKMPGPLADTPGDPLIVGADSAAPVGEYRSPFRFPGIITQVVVKVAEAPNDGLAYGELKTRWTSQVDRKLPRPEYPRPQLVRRDNWTNLNGPWEYAIVPRGAAKPEKWESDTLLVPFPVESQLSGVQRTVGREQALWYRRKFSPPSSSSGENGRVLLHFGAVDWEATVFVNGQKVGGHRGGYDPFTFDITGAVKPGDANELVVRVWDPTDTESHPRGKQVSEPKGIWYTAVTGIWQTVWLEAVPARRVERLVPVPDLDTDTLKLAVEVAGDGGDDSVTAVALDGDREVARATGKAGGTLSLSLPDAKRWSPDSPHLYGLRVELGSGDRVESTFGMRQIALAKDDKGVTRLFLNGEALFHYGPLDQGWWPDGLYTAPTEEAMIHDLRVTKDLGFNTVRKHVKVEPATWYAACDRLGLLVWQDMPTGFRHPTTEERIQPEDAEDWTRPAESVAQWERELEAMMRLTHPFPSVVIYVPHNEGWGQFDTNRIAEKIKALDPTRLVNEVSGWTDRGGGDLIDAHLYPGPGMEPPEQNPGRAVVLGEFGGLGLPLEKNLWWREKRNWGYRTYQSHDELLANYRRVLEDLRPLVYRGLSAAIYTQTTDVEGEVNGLMTYDRAEVKLPAAAVRPLHEALYRTDPNQSVTPLAPDSEVEGQSWRFTETEPEDGNAWTKPGFDDSAWTSALLPIASGLPESEIDPRTGWGESANRYWLRKTFTLDAVPDGGIALKLYAGAKLRVFLNGRDVLEAERQPQHHYRHTILKDAAGALRAGENVLAVLAERGAGPAAGFDAGLYAFPHLPVPENAGANADARPNILFIFIDDMGYGDLSVTGNTHVRTPNMDRLAAEGMTLTQFHVASPICSPSRVAITTGQYPSRSRVNSYLNNRARNHERHMADFLDPARPAIARAFQGAGYATAHFGKWHMGGGRDVGEAPLPQAYGFDEAIVSFEGLGDRVLPPGGLSAASEKLGRGEIRHVAKHEQTPIYVDRSIDFLKRRRHEGRPFYLHLWLNDVHDGHNPSPEQLAKWEGASENPNEVRFFAVLDAMDRDLGRLLDFLDTSGLADNTVVFLTSDNGPTAWPRYYEDGHPPAGSTFGDRGRKWSLYQGGIHMPTFVRWPGHIPAGAENASVSGAVDLFPTFCALAGVEAPAAARAGFDGEDLSAVLLENRVRDRARPLFWEYGRDATYLRPGLESDQSPSLAMRDGDWKVLVNADGTALELYDLAEDPREASNLNGRSAATSERAVQMARRLLAWWRELP